MGTIATIHKNEIVEIYLIIRLNVYPGVVSNFASDAYSSGSEASGT